MRDQVSELQSVESAAHRMSRSRAALRNALLEEEDKIDNHAHGIPSQDGISAGWRLLRRKPSAQLLLSGLQSMWAKNPWHIIGVNALDAASIVLKPVARHSPVKLVAGAFVLGAVLFLIRPRRLLTGSALLAGLLAR